MDYLLFVIIFITLFFTLRTNYKISNLQEKQKKNLQRQKEDFTLLFSKVNKNMESLEKKMVFFQKSLNDLKENQEITAQKNLNVLKKQLIAVKNDTDLIKTIYLKPQKKSEPANGNFLTAEQGLIKQKPERSSEENALNEQVDYLDSFNQKIKEKLKQMSGDEIWILKQLLAQEPLDWQNISELDEEIAMPKFKIPKLSRQFIIDGLPILMIKNAGDKMYVKWGEGLTTDKIEEIQKEIRGDW